MASSKSPLLRHSEKPSDWHDATTKAFKATVAVKVASPFSLDEEGFVFTNRHITGMGPCSGRLIFHNYRECGFEVVYCDPGHDFACLKFNRTEVDTSDLEELSFDPIAVRLGLDVRVVGNTAGQKSSIIEGVITQQFRNTPSYAPPYTEYNMSYIQASLNSGRGSSGSPVVNIEGRVVGIVSGGMGSSLGFILPVDRPSRALEKLIAKEKVTRGTIDVVWELESLAKCRQLQLHSSWDKLIREELPTETRLLVARTTIPEGPADGKIKTGDILLRVNGHLVTKFIALQEILDSHVGQSIPLLVQRHGKDHAVDVAVSDFHKMTPSRSVTVAGATLHNVTYQEAYAHTKPVRGLFVSNTGRLFHNGNQGSGWIITSLQNKDIANVDDFINAVKDISDRSRVPIAVGRIENMTQQQTQVIHLERHWSSIKVWTKDSHTGTWDSFDVADPLTSGSLLPQAAVFPHRKNIDGKYRQTRSGPGNVFAEGIVGVSRAIIPHGMCDITITVANSIEVNAEFLFMHPSYNYCFIKYDPSLVQAPVTSATLSSSNPTAGQSVTFIGIPEEYNFPCHVETTVIGTKTFYAERNWPPSYQPMNFEQVDIVSDFGCGHGVLVNCDGDVQAIWMTYRQGRHIHRFGLPSNLLIPVLASLKDDQIPDSFFLDVQFDEISLSTARGMGVPANWIDQVATPERQHHRLYQVQQVAAPLHPIRHGIDELRPGDTIITLQGQLVTKSADLQVTQEVVDALVVRQGKTMSLQIPAVPTNDWGTDYVVIFAGAVLHRPHHAVRQQASRLYSAIYVNYVHKGTPSDQELDPYCFITSVNGNNVHDMAQFVYEVNKIPEFRFFNISTVDINGQSKSVTLKIDNKFAPMCEYGKDGTGKWKQISRTWKALD
ncbi:Pro-apoptotic serine protease nma111 [Talaromyces islandicus]|uniref:Pro-apoptotic serine protease NMA111 n=1 Tax=Talaromyces islandicus TaxID=28573 RepID=A0A0U1MD66_TALIS|nr:Pro-apoptotic serine protease nma111 [Talaromyces islandicus]